MLALKRLTAEIIYDVATREFGDGHRVDAGLELLDMACDEIKRLFITMAFAVMSLTFLALLVTMYCRRAMAIGVDAQQALEEYWPHDAPWVSRDEH